MTKGEILEAICKSPCGLGDHPEDYDYILSPDKLADFLAKLVIKD